jgi:hypothetical protein
MIDPLTLLDRAFGMDDSENDSFLKNQEARLKLKIETGAEAAALGALQYHRPRLFHKGRPTMKAERKVSRLNRLLSHAQWSGGGEGVKHYAQQQLNSLSATIQSDINYAFAGPGDSKALLVATLSLTSSFCTQWFGLVDATFEKLHEHSKFGEKAAWALTMQILDRISAELY